MRRPLTRLALRIVIVTFLVFNIRTIATSEYIKEWFKLQLLQEFEPPLQGNLATRNQIKTINAGEPKIDIQFVSPRSTEEPVLSDIQKNPQLPRIKIILLRAVGNPLPPRHDSEQAYNNLKFTLENEQEFPDLTKIWFLNRLHNETLLLTLQRLLTAYQQAYVTIPFNLTEYAKVNNHFNYYDPNGDIVHARNYVLRSKRNQFFYDVETAISQEKNLFVTNQNSARNEMIDSGQSYSESITWVLPWDGNCFLHRDSYEAIYRDLLAMPPNHKYAITYMNRAIENDEVLQDVYRPNATEEPQIIFHRTALGRFHPSLHYGRMNKAEFLQRLKVEGKWDHWRQLSEWEKKRLGPFHQPIPDLQNITTDGPVRSVGYVTRLSSGKAALESDGDARNAARFESIRLLLQNLDVRVVTELYGFHPGQLVFYRESALARDRQLYWDGDVVMNEVVEILLRLALRAVFLGPWSVTDKPDDSVARSGDKHDYFDLAPFYWPPLPNATRNSSWPWREYRDEAYPPTLYHAPGSELYDHTRLQDMMRNTTILALAYFMTGDSNFAESAARNIRYWFLDPGTRMNPHMVNSHVATGHNKSAGSEAGILGMSGIYFLLDAIRIIEKSAFLNDFEQRDLRDWFAKYLSWLENSLKGKRAYASPTSLGTYFDVQAIAIAAYLNDTAKMIWYSERSASRLGKQITSNGTMPQEIEDTRCEHNQQFNLQGWSTLTRMTDTIKRNHWTFKSNGNATARRPPMLCRAAKFSIPFFGRLDKCENSREAAEDGTRWWPLFHDAQYYCPMLRNKELQWPIRWFREDSVRPPGSSLMMPSVYDPSDAIAPFWNLGLVHSNINWPT